jgi:photosystem II stability/assembly factor-like uncharacterized protein
MNNCIDVEARSKIIKLENLLSHVKVVGLGPTKGVLVGDEGFILLRACYELGFKEE